MPRNKTFEEYLQEKHAKDYIGFRDEMGEDFREWVNDLNVDEWIAYGENYADEKEGTNQ